jgi:hypothetical protein
VGEVDVGVLDCIKSIFIAWAVKAVEGIDFVVSAPPPQDMPSVIAIISPA